VPRNGKALQDRHRRPGRSPTSSLRGRAHRRYSDFRHYERGEHLIDPQTGERQSRVASASVTGLDLGLADAPATALSVAGEVGLGFIEPIDGYEGFKIGLDGSWKSTRHFPFAPMLNVPRADSGR
jgi:thiamine biosynthesis lipoprotein ApbE